MSAPDRQLLDMLAAQPTPAEKALQRIVNLSERAAPYIGNRELRCYEIALEGLGKGPAERDHMLRQVIQQRRNRIMAQRTQRGGHVNEST